MASKPSSCSNGFVAKRRAWDAARSLDIDDPNAIAYVDDTVRPTHTTIGDLIPGEHHVLVVSNYASHEYSVEVIPRQIARLNIDTDLDAVLALGNDWVGFMYPSQTERTTHEAQYVADLVGKNTSATMAAVLTVHHDNGHLAVTDPLSNELREASPHLPGRAVERERRDLVDEVDHVPDGG